MYEIILIIRHINSVNHFNSVSHVSSANHVNSVNSVNGFSSATTISDGNYYKYKGPFFLMLLSIGSALSSYSAIYPSVRHYISKSVNYQCMHCKYQVRRIYHF